MAVKDKALAIKAKTVERMREAVEPVLEPGEQVVVSAAAAKGPGVWISLLFLGPVGVALFWKNFFVYLTDHRLVFINVSKMGKAQGFAFAYPRRDVSVRSFGKAGPFGFVDVRLQTPDGRVPRLHFTRGKQAWGNGFDEEAQAIAAGLGATTAAV